MNIFLYQTELNTTESQSHIWEEAGDDDDDADDKVNYDDDDDDDDDADDDHCGIGEPRVEWGWLARMIKPRLRDPLHWLLLLVSILLTFTFTFPILHFHFNNQAKAERPIALIAF